MWDCLYLIISGSLDFQFFCEVFRSNGLSELIQLASGRYVNEMIIYPKVAQSRWRFERSHISERKTEKCLHFEKAEDNPIYCNIFKVRNLMYLMWSTVLQQIFNMNEKRKARTDNLFRVGTRWDSGKKVVGCSEDRNFWNAIFYTIYWLRVNKCSYDYYYYYYCYHCYWYYY